MPRSRSRQPYKPGPTETATSGLRRALARRTHGRACSGLERMTQPGLAWWVAVGDGHCCWSVQHQMMMMLSLSTITVLCGVSAYAAARSSYRRSAAQAASRQTKDSGSRLHLPNGTLGRSLAAWGWLLGAGWSYPGLLGVALVAALWHRQLVVVRNERHNIGPARSVIGQK